jgi:hypothetical protein
MILVDTGGLIAMAVKRDPEDLKAFLAATTHRKAGIFCYNGENAV